MRLDISRLGSGSPLAKLAALLSTCRATGESRCLSPRGVAGGARPRADYLTPYSTLRFTAPYQGAVTVGSTANPDDGTGAASRTPAQEHSLTARAPAFAEVGATHPT